MSTQELLTLAGLALTLVLISMRRAEAGLPVPGPADFPDQGDSPFGADPTGFPVVIY